MPAPAQQNQMPVAWVNKIKDPDIRQAVLECFKQIGAINQELKNLGRLTKPLTTELNASNNRLTRLNDPQDPQDAVTLRYLQDYVANFASQFHGSQAGAGGGDPDDAPDSMPEDGIPDHSDVVTSVWNATPVGPGSPEVELYRFVQSVARALETVDAPLTCGLLYKGSGANIYVCSGESYSISRICYDNGHVFKVLIDADPGGSRTPTWASNPPLLLEDYRAVSGSGTC